MRLSIYFSSIVKSGSNPFMEPTSAQQRGKSFLPKETMGTSKGGSYARLTDYESDTLPTMHAFSRCYALYYIIVGYII